MSWNILVTHTKPFSAKPKERPCPACSQVRLQLRFETTRAIYYFSSNFFSCSINISANLKVCPCATLNCLLALNIFMLHVCFLLYRCHWTGSKMNGLAIFKMKYMHYALHSIQQPTTHSRLLQYSSSKLSSAKFPKGVKLPIHLAVKHAIVICNGTHIFLNVHFVLFFSQESPKYTDKAHYTTVIHIEIGD